MNWMADSTELEDEISVIFSYILIVIIYRHLLSILFNHILKINIGNNSVSQTSG
jgi:hypothetical protein